MITRQQSIELARKVAMVYDSPACQAAAMPIIIWARRGHKRGVPIRLGPILAESENEDFVLFQIICALLDCVAYSVPSSQLNEPVDLAVMIDFIGQTLEVNRGPALSAIEGTSLMNDAKGILSNATGTAGRDTGTETYC